MLQFLFVGIGGFFGAILRYIVSVKFVQNIPGQLPLGTISVNMLGCFLIGIVMHIFLLKHNTNSAGALIIITGFLGAFTTFSTFGLEIFELLRQNNFKMALITCLLQVILGVLLVFLGWFLVKMCR